MGAPYNNLLRRVEDALKAYIMANDAPDSAVGVYRSMDEAAITGAVVPPCYIISAIRRRSLLADTVPDQIGLPPSIVSAQIVCRTIARDEEAGGVITATARERHDLLVGRLLDLLTTGTVAAELSTQGVENLAVDQCDAPDEAFAVDGDRIETTITFDLVARSVTGA